MVLDLSALESSVRALERALGVTRDAAQWDVLSANAREAVRAGVIQTFEVAYEQSWKMLRRWLELNPMAGDASVSTMRQVYRLAAKSGLIDNVDLWMEFHAARNQTAHTYNRKTAEDVFGLTAVFLPEARNTLAALEVRND